MPRCSLIGCDMKIGLKHAKITLYRLPKNEEKKYIWLQIIGNENLNKSTKTINICSLDFEESCFIETQKLVKLRDALPSRVLLSSPKESTSGILTHQNQTTSEYDAHNLNEDYEELTTVIFKCSTSDNKNMIEENNNTLWCGNLAEQVTEELLYELFLQAGPLESVRIPRDRDGRQKTFAFITFCHEVSVPYAINLFRGTALFNKTLLLQCRGRMPLLPPPIRCYGPEPLVNFNLLPKVADQFSEMTKQLTEQDLGSVQSLRQNQELLDKLVVASLQGNWSHRHHPYRSDNPHARDDFRPREPHHKGGHRNSQSNSWRDRRNNRRGGYHKRD